MMTLQNIIKDKNTHIIDVREIYEYEAGHLEGAIHIPLSELGHKVNDFKKMKGQKVLYCRSGNRSGQAVAFLKQQGIDHIYNGGSMMEVQASMMN